MNLTREQFIERQTISYAESGEIDALLKLYDDEADPILKKEIENYINKNGYMIALVSDILPPEQIIDLNRLRELRDVKRFHDAIRNYNFANIQNLFAQVYDKEVGLPFLLELLDLLNYDSREIKSTGHVGIYFSALVLHKQRLEEEYIWQGQLENIQSIAETPASYSSNVQGGGKLSQAKVVRKATEDFLAAVTDFAIDLPEERYKLFLKNLRSVNKEFAKEVKEISDEKRKEAQEEAAAEELDREENED